MLRYLRSKKGFTMVELIVVIAIIGILAGIIVPMMSGAGRPQEADTKAESFYYALQNIFIDYKANNPENTPGYYTLADGTELDDDSQYFMVYAEATQQDDFTDVKVAVTPSGTLPSTQYNIVFTSGVSDPAMLTQLNAKTSGDDFGYYYALVDSECRVIETYWCRDGFDEVFDDYKSSFAASTDIMFTSNNYIGPFCVGSFPNMFSVKDTKLFLTT